MYEKILKEAQDIIAEREQQIAELEAQRNDAQSKADKAAQDKAEAEAKTDGKAYAAANAKLRELQDIISMYNNKLSNLRTQPLIDDHQYDLYKRNLIKYLDEINRESKSRLDAVFEPIEQERNRLQSEYEKVNNLIHKLQREMARQGDTKIITHADGRTENRIVSDDKYHKMDLIWAYNQILANKSLLGEKQ